MAWLVILLECWHSFTGHHYHFTPRSLIFQKICVRFNLKRDKRFKIFLNFSPKKKIKKNIRELYWSFLQKGGKILSILFKISRKLRGAYELWEFNKANFVKSSIVVWVHYNIKKILFFTMFFVVCICQTYIYHWMMMNTKKIPLQEAGCNYIRMKFEVWKLCRKWYVKILNEEKMHKKVWVSETF